MNKNKTTKQKSAKGCSPLRREASLTAENYRTFELCGRTIIIDDFIYRRIFKDPGIKPKRKYTFIKSFYLANGCPRMVLKEGKNKTILLSRYIMHAGKGEIVDHINRNPLDNRRCNLRAVNSRQNMLNRKTKNKTGMIGVTGGIRDGKFYLRANFRANKTKRLRFNCPDTPFNRILAALAHDKFVLQAGEEAYAPLNFPRWKEEPYRSFLLNEDLGKYKEKSRRKVNSGAVDKKLNFTTENSVPGTPDREKIKYRKQVNPGEVKKASRGRRPLLIRGFLTGKRPFLRCYCCL